MTKASPASPENEQPSEQSGEQPTVTGVVSDQPGNAGDVPAGTEPMGAQVAGAGAPDGEQDDTVEVYLAHHWTDPKTGQSYAPETPVRVDADTANSLRGAKYLLNPDAVDALKEQQAAQEETTAVAEGEDGGQTQGEQTGQEGEQQAQPAEQG